MQKSLLISLIALALAVAGLWLPQADLDLGGQTSFSGPVNSQAGFQESGTEVIDTSGNYVGAVDTGSNSLTVGSNGSAVDQVACGSSSWDPGAVSSSTAPETLDISVSDAALGDVCTAALGSATSTDNWFVSCKVTGSGTSTIALQGTNAAASTNLSTSTARVCTLQL